MARKEFLYRGKKIDELRELSMKELSELMPSNVRRRINKGFTDDQKKLLENIRTKSKVVKTHCRTMPILPEMVDKTIKVYNGKDFVEITIQPEMVGHIIGEYSPSRKSIKHSSPGVGATKSSSSMSVR